MTRAEHLKWCKDRALEYVEIGKLDQALASMTSDVRKHPETENHFTTTCRLGLSLFMAGQLNTAAEMRKFIEGFN